MGLVRGRLRAGDSAGPALLPGGACPSQRGPLAVAMAASWGPGCERAGSPRAARAPGCRYGPDALSRVPTGLGFRLASRRKIPADGRVELGVGVILALADARGTNLAPASPQADHGRLGTGDPHLVVPGLGPARASSPPAKAPSPGD